MSHMCIANLLKIEIDRLKDNDLIISVDLLDEFTQFVIFDTSGPLCIKRLASIKNYPSIEELRKINEGDIDSNKKSKKYKNQEKYNAKFHSLNNPCLLVLQIHMEMFMYVFLCQF